MRGGLGLDRKQIPKPGFLDTCDYLDYIQGERRWRSRVEPALYTWDFVHGEIEKFDFRGQHSGVLDALTGKRIKPARKGRRIRV